MNLDALRKSVTRAEHVARGRALGEAEADSRKETEPYRSERVKRAMVYAAWEWDGKPATSEVQRAEFELPDSSLTRSLDRAVFGRLLKRGKDE